MLKVPIPTYLNKLYLAHALQTAYKVPQVVVKTIKLKRLTEDGENFCSDIYRLSVNFQCDNLSEKEQEKDFIVKILLTEIEDIGSNEHDMLTKVLPVIDDILSEHGVSTKLHAHCLWTDRINKELYILEDLNALGYQSANRIIGLDEAHTRVALKKVAQLHAASMVFARKHPDLTAALDSSQFVNGASDPISESISIGGINYVSEVISQWSGFEEIAAKVKKILPTYNDRMKLMGDHRNSKVNAILHGDFWVNNILFSYKDDGSPKDTIFVDFQNSYWMSVAIDLNFFMYTSVQLDVLQSKRDELMRHYYDALASTLQCCNYKDIPSWQMFLDDLRSCEFYGLYAVACELPICCMDKAGSKGFTVQTFTDPVALLAKRKLMYVNQRVIATIKYALERYNDLGVLD